MSLRDFKAGKLVVDKDVYESALRNSMCLRAENEALRLKIESLKELLKECHSYIVNTPVYAQGDKQYYKDMFGGDNRNFDIERGYSELTINL